MWRGARLARFVITLFLGLIFGVVGRPQAQQVAYAPDPSAAIHYVAATCPNPSGGSEPCSDTNSGLSWGAAKASIGGALPSGNLIHVAPNVSMTESSQLTIGANKTVVLPPSGSWSFNLGSGCGLTLGDNASLAGWGTPVGSGAFALTAPSSATMSALLCNSGNYFSANNLLLYNPNGASFSNGLLYVSNSADDNTYVSNIESANYNGVSLKIDSSCCSADFNHVVLNGNDGTGAQPLLITNNGTHHVEGINFFSTSVTHAGSGQYLVDLNDSSAGCGAIHFFGLYMQDGGGAVPDVDDGCFGSVAIFGADYNDTTTGPVLQIENVGRAGHSVDAFALVDAGPTLVNDMPNSVSITDAGYPINYANEPSYFTDLHVVGSSGSLTVGSGSSITSSGAGGMMASSGPNGISAGTCTISGGMCSHTFANSNSYTAAPVCIVASTVQLNYYPPYISAASTSQVTVTAPSAANGTVMNWICYPATN